MTHDEALRLVLATNPGESVEMEELVKAVFASKIATDTISDVMCNTNLPLRGQLLSMYIVGICVGRKIGA